MDGDSQSEILNIIVIMWNKNKIRIFVVCLYNTLSFILISFDFGCEDLVIFGKTTMIVFQIYLEMRVQGINM